MKNLVGYYIGMLFLMISVPFAALAQTLVMQNPVVKFVDTDGKPIESTALATPAAGKLIVAINIARTGKPNEKAYEGHVNAQGKVDVKTPPISLAEFFIKPSGDVGEISMVIEDYPLFYKAHLGGWEVKKMEAIVAVVGAGGKKSIPLKTKVKGVEWKGYYPVPDKRGGTQYVAIAIDPSKKPSGNWRVEVTLTLAPQELVPVKNLLGPNGQSALRLGVSDRTAPPIWGNDRQCKYTDKVVYTYRGGYLGFNPSDVSQPTEKEPQPKSSVKSKKTGRSINYWELVSQITSWDKNAAPAQGPMRVKVEDEWGGVLPNISVTREKKTGGEEVTKMTESYGVTPEYPSILMRDDGEYVLKVQGVQGYEDLTVDVQTSSLGSAAAPQTIVLKRRKLGATFVVWDEDRDMRIGSPTFSVRRAFGNFGVVYTQEGPAHGQSVQWGNYQWDASAAGFVSKSAQSLDVHEVKDYRLNLRLERKPITFHVTSKTGNKDVANVSIVVKDKKTGKMLGTGTTTAGGRVIIQLPLLDVTWEVTPPSDYKPGRVSGNGGGTLDAGKEVRIVVEESPKSYSGLQIVVADEQGHAVSGAKVMVGATTVAESTTAGTYTLTTPLAQGDYSVTVQKDGYCMVDAAGSSITKVDFTLGSNNQKVAVKLARNTVPLTVLVKEAPPSEQTIDGLEVTVIQDGVRTAVTNSTKGVYAFPDLKSGTVTIEVVDKQDPKRYDDNKGITVVLVKYPVENKLIRMTKRNNNPECWIKVVGKDWNTGIDGAAVTVTLPDKSTLELEDRGKGMYYTKQLPKGTYTYKVEKTGYVSEEFKGEDAKNGKLDFTLPLQTPAGRHPVVQTLYEKVTVTITVYAHDGTPVGTGVKVKLSGALKAEQATGPDSKVRFVDIRAKDGLAATAEKFGRNEAASVDLDQLPAKTDYEIRMAKSRVPTDTYNLVFRINPSENCDAVKWERTNGVERPDEPQFEAPNIYRVTVVVERGTADEIAFMFRKTGYKEKRFGIAIQKDIIEDGKLEYDVVLIPEKQEVAYTIPEAIVEASALYKVLHKGLSGSDGVVVENGLTEGSTYRVVIMRDGYTGVCKMWEASAPLIEDIELEPAPKPKLNFGKRVSFTVTDPNGGAALGMVEVEAVEPGGNALPEFEKQYTDPQGRTVFYGVKSGDYEFRFRKAGYVLKEHVQVKVEAEDVEMNIQLAREASTSLGGESTSPATHSFAKRVRGGTQNMRLTIKDKNGDLLSGAKVYVMESSAILTRAYDRLKGKPKKELPGGDLWFEVKNLKGYEFFAVGVDDVLYNKKSNVYIDPQETKPCYGWLVEAGWFGEPATPHMVQLWLNSKVSEGARMQKQFVYLKASQEGVLELSAGAASPLAMEQMIAVKAGTKCTVKLTQKKGMVLEEDKFGGVFQEIWDAKRKTDGGITEAEVDGDKVYTMEFDMPKLLFSQPVMYVQPVFALKAVDYEVLWKVENMKGGDDLGFSEIKVTDYSGNAIKSGTRMPKDRMVDILIKLDEEFEFVSLSLDGVSVDCGRLNRLETLEKTYREKVRMRKDMHLLAVVRPLEKAMNRPVSVAKEAFESLEVYPVPMRSVLHVRGVDRAVRYSLYNALGQLVRSGQRAQGGEFFLNVEGLSRGMYIFEVEGNGRSSKRVRLVK